MNKNISYFFEVSSKFHFTYFIKGWLKHRSGIPIHIQDISCRHINKVAIIFKEEKVPHLQDSNAVGFTIQILLSENTFPRGILLDFSFTDGSFDTIDDSMITQNLQSFYKENLVAKKFWELLKEDGYSKILDIGGRARSGLDRSKEFLNKDVTIIDIIDDVNVDVVGDAHLLSNYFDHGYFDVVYCVSVFEHIIMPWKVAIEMNKVMKLGGIGLIHTHQTIGMHDIPWDYYRYSDTSWKGIFNSFTGFEILATDLRDTNYIIPFCYKDKHENAEKSAGFESSSVLVKKISETDFDWPIGAENVTQDTYPDQPDGNKIENYEDDHYRLQKESKL